MRNKKIFARTRLGNDCLEGSKPGVAGISGDEKRVMVLIDGKSSLDEIVKKTPVSVQVNFDAIIGRLLASRFIAESGNPAIAANLKVSGRISREDVQVNLMASQKLNKNMLVLAEIEIERRMELEQDLLEANARLQAALDEVESCKVQLEAEAAQYQTLKQQVLAYKKGMQIKIGTLQMHIEKISGDKQENRVQRERAEADLKQMREDFENMQAVVEAKEAALADTLKSRMVEEKRAEEEKHKQLKIEADEMLRANPRYNQVRRLEFFKDFRNSDIAQFLAYAEWREVEAGEVVVAEGEAEVMFYVIVSGKLVVMKGAKTLHVFQAGEPFGEIAYMDDENPLRSATIKARTDCLLLVFNPAYLDEAELIFRMRVAEAFVRVQARRLRRAVEVVNNLLADNGGKT